MGPIDFLPPKYREQSALDQAKLWHLGVVCIFGAMIAGAAIFQFSMRCSVSAELAEVDQHYLEAQALAQKLTLTAQDLERARGEARLYAYLRHDWPRTQILALLATSFPDEVTLTETRLDISIPESARMAAQSERQNAPPPNPGAVPPPKPAAAIADLAKLRSLRESALSVLHLTGSTRDVSALHSYLAELAAHPLVAKAELLSLEQSGPAGSSVGEQSLFRARVSIRPNYSQIGGPAMPAEPAPNAAVARPAAPVQPSEALAGGTR